MTVTLVAAEDGMPGEDRHVEVGSRVRLLDSYGVAEFTIVSGEAGEAADATSAQLIPVKSRLGQALLGRKAGDRIQVRTPIGMLEVRVVEVL